MVRHPTLALLSCLALLSALAAAGEPAERPVADGRDGPHGGGGISDGGGEPVRAEAPAAAGGAASDDRRGGGPTVPDGGEPESPASDVASPAEPAEAAAAGAAHPAAPATMRPVGAEPGAGRAVEEPSDPDRPPADRFQVHFASDTVVRLFERAALPGPGGAQRVYARHAPIYEYASVHIRDLDVPWQPDSIDVQLASWGQLELSEVAERRRLDGDISIASVRHRLGPAYVVLGRQIRAGGAARFVRLDGLSAGLRAPFGLGADGYGGFDVLPRWSGQSGYHLLGSTADTMLRAPEAAPDPSREEHWLAGGRIYYAHGTLGEVGASFHEQHEAGELGRRNLGLDLVATPHEVIQANAQALIDGDAWDLAELRGSVDVYPVETLSLAAEYQHAMPALFLSRQSVLSVFSTDAFDEVGGMASYRPIESLALSAGGYVDVFSDSSVGMRLVGRARLEPLPTDRLVVHLGYRRVTETENGYHVLRSAAGYRLVDPVTLTAESYWYFYDEPVRAELPVPMPEVSFSWVGATHATWTFLPGWSALLGGSLSSTPYAATDAQALARLRLELFWGEGS